MLSSLWNFDAHPITVDSPTRWVVGVAGETILDNGIAATARLLLRLVQPLKRIINGFEVDWTSERVFAERQTTPNYGYLFEVSTDRKRIVRSAHISTIGEASDNRDGDAERLKKARGELLRSS